MDFQRFFDTKIESVRKITEGFSVDDKYVINEKYLIKVISMDRIDRFRFAYQTQLKFYKVAKCQKPISLIIEKPLSFYITEYIPGENGLFVINNFTFQQQYDFGVEAGLELFKFHQANKIPNFDVESYLRKYFYDKVDIARKERVVDYIPEIESLISIVESNLHLFNKFEGFLTHSDYHLFNMIFDGQEYKGVIDFERCRNSIFLTDFRNNTPHNSRTSPHFASGIIDGYLHENPIEDFFVYYNLHDLMISIAAIPWVKKYNAKNLTQDIHFIRNLFNDIGDISKIPKWYVGEH